MSKCFPNSLEWMENLQKAVRLGFFSSLLITYPCVMDLNSYWGNERLIKCIFSLFIKAVLCVGLP